VSSGGAGYSDAGPPGIPQGVLTVEVAPVEWALDCQLVEEVSPWCATEGGGVPLYASQVRLCCSKAFLYGAHQ